MQRRPPKRDPQPRKTAWREAKRWKAPQSFGNKRRLQSNWPAKPHSFWSKLRRRKRCRLWIVYSRRMWILSSLARTTDARRDLWMWVVIVNGKGKAFNKLDFSQKSSEGKDLYYVCFVSGSPLNNKTHPLSVLFFFFFFTTFEFKGLYVILSPANCVLS